MIATITLNPCLDQHITVDGLVMDGTNRWSKLHRYAGGKGIDVSRAIHEMGGKTTAYGFIGGPVGRQVEILLDIEDPIPQEYILEVSSLGLDRPLKQRKDFLRCSGKLIRLITSMAVGGKKNFTGILKDTEEDRIQVELRNGKIVWISLSDIVKAQLEIEF